MNEVIGYRCWRIRTFRTADPTLVEVAGQLAIPYAVALTSLTRDDPWPSPVMHADEKPTSWNSSGLYFLDTPQAARDYERAAEVTGSASLYGKIVEHRGGWRSQHAALRSLTIHTYRLQDIAEGNIAQQIVALARVLERRYQCEVLIDASTAELTDLQKLMAKVKDGTITAEDLAALVKKFGILATWGLET
jgi:hypothetical protein